MGGGTGIFIDRRIQYENITRDFSDFGVEVTVIRFTFRTLTICFCAVYLPQSRTGEITDFLAFLDKILLLDTDILLVCGDFNSWHVAWGDRNNRRGEALYKGVIERGLNVERNTGITRVGHRGQRDTYVDLVISNAGSRMSELVNSFQISDHIIISGSVAVARQNQERRVKRWDFRNTYLKYSKELTSFFENLNWRRILSGALLEEIPDIMNRTILAGWELHGIHKWVNANSKPWFSLEVKEWRREARFWERQLARARKNARSIVVDGVLYSIDECRERHKHALKIWRDGVARLKVSCDSYINRLLSKGVFQTIRRIYKSKHKTIPVLKIIKDGRVQRVKDNRGKAEVFQHKFLENTIPSGDFEEDKNYVKECARNCNIELRDFECVGNVIRRLCPLPERVSADDIDRIISLMVRCERRLDPCESYFRLEEIKDIRRTLKKERGE